MAPAATFRNITPVTNVLSFSQQNWYLFTKLKAVFFSQKLIRPYRITGLTFPTTNILLCHYSENSYLGNWSGLKIASIYLEELKNITY
jgi:hypothetical protein